MSLRGRISIKIIFACTAAAATATSPAFADKDNVSNAPPVKEIPAKPIKRTTKPERGTVEKPGVEKPAPLTENATQHFERTQAELNQRQADATANLSGGNAAGCTGLLCLGSLTNAAQAAASAASIAAYAANAHNQALARRNEIREQIYAGAQSGRYPVQSVQDLNQMFKANPRPPDEEIEQLHPEIRDGATALRINQEERDVLKEAHEKHTKTANAAQGMHNTLQGHAERGTTLAPGGIRGGRGNAAYPTGIKGGAGINAGNSVNNASDITSRSEEQLEAGRSQGIEAGLAGGKTGGPLAAASGALDAKGDAKKDNKGAPNGPEQKSAQAPAEADGKKTLSSEGKAMLAGMLKELKDDIAKGLIGGDQKNMVVTDASGKKVAIDNVPSGSALEGMLLTMDSKGAQRGPASLASGPSSPELPASSQQLSDLDFFGIDKSLFVRVKDYFRGRGQRDENFAGRN